MDNQFKYKKIHSYGLSKNDHSEMTIAGASPMHCLTKAYIQIIEKEKRLGGSSHRQTD